MSRRILTPLNVSHYQIMLSDPGKTALGVEAGAVVPQQQVATAFSLQRVFSNRQEIIPDHIDPFSAYPGLTSLTDVCLNNLKWRIFPLVICVLIHTASCGLVFKCSPYCCNCFATEVMIWGWLSSSSHFLTALTRRGIQWESDKGRVLRHWNVGGTEPLDKTTQK